MSLFEFKELFSLTLESIPGKLEITIKDKDMVNDKIMGYFMIDPQKQKIYQDSKKKEHQLEFQNGNTKIVFYC